MTSLSVRSLDGSRILGLFDPPSRLRGRVPEALADALTRAALACAESHATEGAVVWVDYQPRTIYRELHRGR